MLEGKLALVTGASRGIGKAIAQELGRQGATIIGTATTAEGAEKITTYLQQSSLQGRGYALNICDGHAIEQVLADIQAEFEAPHILINNAGITRDNIMLRMKPDQWDEVINTNLSAVFRLTKACIKPMFKARSGRIVNISSVVGILGNPGQANYVAAKAGLIGFTKSLALEFATFGITANCVAPGFIQTDMTASIPDKLREGLLARIPMQRMGRPEDVAKAVSFLTSDHASYITGETLHVNGGISMV